MTAAERRNAILRLLGQSSQPLSATSLAQRFSVTRQVVVGDVALLRSGGSEIVATPRGYLLFPQHAAFTHQVACIHDAAGTKAELNAMVDNGCTVLDVIVEHPVYGQLTAPLQLACREDVQQFLARMERSDAVPLSALTEGVHLHTVSCSGEDVFRRMKAALDALGFLLAEDGD